VKPVSDRIPSPAFELSDDRAAGSELLPDPPFGPLPGPHLDSFASPAGGAPPHSNCHVPDFVAIIAGFEAHSSSG
jgi:hypothetical protein